MEQFHFSGRRQKNLGAFANQSWPRIEKQSNKTALFENRRLYFYFLSPESGYHFPLLKNSSGLVETIKHENLCH